MRKKVKLRDVKVGQEFYSLRGTHMLKIKDIHGQSSNLVYLESYASLEKGDATTWGEDNEVEIEAPLTFEDIEEGQEFTYKDERWIKVKPRNSWNAVCLELMSNCKRGFYNTVEVSP